MQASPVLPHSWVLLQVAHKHLTHSYWSALRLAGALGLHCRNCSPLPSHQRAITVTIPAQHPGQTWQAATLLPGIQGLCWHLIKGIYAHTALAAWAALATASGFWHHLSGSHAISGRQWQSHAGHTAGGQAPASVGLSLAEQPILPPCAGGADCSLPPGRRHLACGIPPCACLESGVSAAGGVARLPGGINSGLRYKAKQCCGRASLAASLHYLSSLPAVTAADMLAAVGDLHEPARLTAPPGNCTDESSSNLH